MSGELEGLSIRGTLDKLSVSGTLKRQSAALPKRLSGIPSTSYTPDGQKVGNTFSRLSVKCTLVWLSASCTSEELSDTGTPKGQSVALKRDQQWTAHDHGYQWHTSRPVSQLHR